VVDDGVLSRLENEVEVAPVHGVLRPPAVDDTPLFADERNVLPVDARRRAVGMAFDERRTGLIQSACV
jgi:hypothetical protein